ncbi:DUF4012 domain-containing protein [Rhodococcus aerolatus]
MSTDGPGPDGDSPRTTTVRRRRRRSAEARKRRRNRRILLGTGGGVALVVVVLGLWLAYGATAAQHDLEAARDHAGRARAALLDGDTATAQREVDLATESSGSARNATSALPWHLIAPLPGLGEPFATARDLTEVVDDLSRTVLQPAAAAGQALSPAQLRGAGGQINLTALTSARAPLARAAAASADVAARARAIPDSSYLTQVNDARSTLVEQTTQLADLLRDTSTAATLLPPMLGSGGARHYFLGFQTNAEARGTGGLLGGFSIVDADRGKVSLDTVASNAELRNDAPAGLDLGPDFAQLYGRYDSTTVWQNSNISPHFPYAARIWGDLWQRQSGQRLDGAMATDPVALSYLLGAVGPVTLPGGESVTADNVVALTESEAYTRFADDNTARKAFLTGIASAVFDEVVAAPPGATTGLLRALGRAAGEGRLMVYSADAGEQQVIETTPLAHAVPDTAAPYAGVVLTNASGGKIDYYVGRSIDYTAEGCSAATRATTVRLTLTNAAPTTGLPSYVAGRLDQNPTGPPGTVRELVTVYATQGAALRSVTVDGVAQAAEAGSERGHPVFRVDLQVVPGTSPVVELDLVEPTTEGAAVVPVQPLVRPAEVTTRVPECRLAD